MTSRILCSDPDTIEAKVWELQEILKTKHWKYLDKGRHRVGYLSPRGDRVIKIAHCPHGIAANMEEFELSRDAKLLAKTFPNCDIAVAKVYGLGSYIGLSILCMEFIEFKGIALKDYPKWAERIDCYQVGYNKDRKMVAFDFSQFRLTP